MLDQLRRRAFITLLGGAGASIRMPEIGTFGVGALSTRPGWQHPETWK
jgi:hypothetical protein